MIEIPTLNEGLSRLFYYLANCYDNKRFPSFEAVYQFILKEGEKDYYYYISISDGKAVSYEGKHSSPSIKIYSPLSVLLDIANDKLNPYWGFLTRKYRIEGSLYYLRHIKKIFGRRFDKSDIPEMGEEIDGFEMPNRRIWKKPEKVLVINGSPHQKEGFTYFYLQYLLKGIRNAGAVIELIDLYNENINIKPCNGCFACWFKTPGLCTIEDSADELLKKVDNAYLVIYALPLCTDSIPAKLKAFWERHLTLLLPYMRPYYNLTRHPRINKKEQYIALFSISGFSELGQFKPLIETFKAHSRNIHMPLIATILRPGAETLLKSLSCRDYLKKVLNSLEQAGKELIEKGKVSRGILKIISKNYTPIKNWQRRVNMHCYLELKENK